MDQERASHPNVHRADATMNNFGHCHETYTLMPVENERWMVVDTRGQCITTEGNIVEIDHCWTCGSADRLEGVCHNCGDSGEELAA